MWIIKLIFFLIVIIVLYFIFWEFVYPLFEKEEIKSNDIPKIDVQEAPKKPRKKPRKKMELSVDGEILKNSDLKEKINSKS